ncbi:MAG: type II and III secretion system protein [Planctomycetaceae bacterium]|nr:type II and III secretion system protein [Planctomycetaceae bacterium]
MESTRKKQSGFFAVALGITTAVASVGLLSHQPAFCQPYSNNQAAANVGDHLALLRQKSQQLLIAARTSLAGGDHITAEKQIQEAVSLKASYAQSDDRPEYVNELIKGHRAWLQTANAQGNTEQTRRIRAENLACQADGFCRHGNYDMAEKLAREAAAQNVPFSNAMVGKKLDPASIMNTINDARIVQAARNNPSAGVESQYLSATVQRQASGMIPKLAEARQALKVGKIQEAEVIVQQLLSQNVPESAFATFGDSPVRLKTDIAAMRLNAARQYGNQNNNSAAMQRQYAVQPAYNPLQDNTANIQIQGARSDFLTPGNFPGQTSPASAVDANQAQAGNSTNVNRQASEHEFAAEVLQQITRSQQLMAENPPKLEEAISNLQETRKRANAAEISQDMKSRLLSKIDGEITQIDDYNAKYGSAIRLERENRAVYDALDEEQKRKSYVEIKLKEYVEEYRSLMREERFAEANAVAEKARAIDPNHPIITQMTYTSQTADRQRQMDIARNNQERGIWSAFIDQHNSAVLNVNDRNPLVGPEYSQWQQYTQRSSIDVAGAELSESELKIYQVLNQLIKLNTNGEKPLGAVIEKLQEDTGINIILDAGAQGRLVGGTTPVGTPDEWLVSLELNYEIKLRSALNLLLGRYGLSYTVRNEALYITDKNRSRGPIQQKVYYVGDLALQQQKVVHMSPMDKFAQAMDIALGRHRGFGMSGNSAVNPAATPVNFQRPASLPNGINPQIMGEGGYYPSNTNQFNPYNNNPYRNNAYGNYGYGAAGGGVNYSDLIMLIQTTIDPESWSGGGYGTTGTTGTRGGSTTMGGGLGAETTTEGGEEAFGQIYPFDLTLTLIINQTEENHQKIQDLLTQLRKMNDIQISVEVRYVTLTDNFFEAMGMDFDVSFRNSKGNTFASLNNGNSTNTSTSTSDDDSSTILNTTAFTNAVKNSNLIAGLLPGGTTAAPNFAPGLGVSLNQNSMGISVPEFGGYQSGAGASVGFAILSDIESYLFLNAAQGDSRTNILQAPKVTFMNGRDATLTNQTYQNFVVGVIPVVGDFAVAQQPVIQQIPNGFTLYVQGVVSSDRRYVRMNLTPSFYSLDANSVVFTFDGSTSSTTDSTGSNSSTTTNSSSGTSIQEPQVSEFSLPTAVSVPDGGTLLLGGVKRLSEGRRDAGIPMVNKIPYLKRLFSNTSVGRESQTIMLMVTPHIIIQDEYETAMGAAVESR